MDLTPRLLTEVEFREEWRGYNRKEVDDFLERVALAVGELQERLRDSAERTEAAERRLLEQSTDDDEIRRTLVLAQRTAMTAVEEARAEAQRIRDEAIERAQERLGAAEARLAEIDREVNERSQAQLGDLAERRRTLQADVDALEAFAEEHRGRLRAELERQLAALDQVPASLVVPAPPTLSEPEPELEPEPEVEVQGGPTDEEVARAREELVEALRRAGIEDEPGEAAEPAPEAEDEPELTWAPAPLDVVGEPTGETPAIYDAADESGELDLAVGEATSFYDALADEAEADGETEDVVDWSAGGGEDDDPFLAELRRAVTDTEPLGPRDPDLAEPVPERQEAVPSGRFRRRRGR